MGAAMAAWRAGRVRNQRGFALAAVLAVIALTSLTIAALVGMLITTVLATSTQERAARELRAADAAIESAVAQMRRSSTGNGGDPCAVAAPLAPVDQMTFDLGSADTGDDVAVQVACEPAGLGDPAATSDQVRLVGADGYQGDIAWNDDCAGASTGPGCFPWTAAIGQGAPSITPNLVHSGSDALRFDSGLTVKRGAAVLGDVVDGPALSASGQYLQGDVGPLSGSGPVCGVLDPAGGAPAAVVDDLDDAPQCDSAQARDVDASPTDALVGFAVSSATPVVPACSPGGLTQIPAAAYDATLTAQLNSLFASCTSTFQFLPGVISFDADALVLDSPGSYFVFGAPQGWGAGGVASSAVANDPAAPLCDPAVSGTSVVLSGRTEIRHLGGRVAICPSHSGVPDEPFPAVYQETSVPGVTVSPVQALPLNFTFRCGLFDPPCAGGLVATRTYAVDVTAPAGSARPLDSVKVLLAGTEGNSTQNNLITARRTVIQVMRGATTVCSTGALNGTPNGELTSSFELLSGACATALDDEADLAGTRLQISHQLTLASILVTQPLTVTAVDVMVNPTVGEAASVAGSSGWTSAGSVLDDDGAAATAEMPCASPICEVAAGTPARTPSNRWLHTIELDDIDLDVPPALAGGPIDPNVTDLRVMMDVDPGAIQAARPDMQTRLQLTTADGQRCYVDGGSVNAAMQISFDLLGAAGAEPGCSAVLENYSQLRDVDLTVEIGMACLVVTGAEWECAKKLLDPNTIYRPSPPAIEHIWLAAATDTYSGAPPTSQLTIDATADADGSSFNTLGKVWMPLSDLDIHWNGAVTQGRSVVGDDLVLNGLGSEMASGAQMGIVCCSSAQAGSRTVEMTASVGGDAVLQVTVLFTDVDPAAPSVYSPGFAVDVLEWSTCDDSGCSPGGP